MNLDFNIKNLKSGFSLQLFIHSYMNNASARDHVMARGFDRESHMLTIKKFSEEGKKSKFWITE